MERKNKKIVAGIMAGFCVLSTQSVLGNFSKLPMRGGNGLISYAMKSRKDAKKSRKDAKKPEDNDVKKPEDNDVKEPENFYVWLPEDYDAMLSKDYEEYDVMLSKHDEYLELPYDVYLKECWPWLNKYDTQISYHLHKFKGKVNGPLGRYAGVAKIVNIEGFDLRDIDTFTDIARIGVRIKLCRTVKFKGEVYKVDRSLSNWILLDGKFKLK